MDLVLRKEGGIDPFSSLVVIMMVPDEDEGYYI
jgi:hypothetical protein